MKEEARTKEEKRNRWKKTIWQSPQKSVAVCGGGGEERDLERDLERERERKIEKEKVSD